jgi:ABC-type lipoprotein release transport system permease subunit
MESISIIESMLNNVLFTVIFFICLLSFILIFSLMQSDIEERTYEFAILRTLGLKNVSLIILIFI